MSFSPKLALFTEFAAIAKTLGHAHRLELLEQLAQGERSVEVLAEPNGPVDRQCLAASATVEARRRCHREARGQVRLITRSPTTAFSTCSTALRRIAKRNVAEVERVIRSYFDERDELEPVSRQQLQKRSRAGEVTVLDVRPPDEFALGHLPGAVNIPLRALKSRLAELDPAQEIVAYCRGEYCVLSFEAVALLRTRGFKVRRLEDGLPEWRAAGLPVVTGSD